MVKAAGDAVLGKTDTSYSGYNSQGSVYEML